MSRKTFAATTAMVMMAGVPAFAQSAGCLEINGASYPSSRFGEAFTADALNAGEVISLNADYITSDGFPMNAGAFVLQHLGGIIGNYVYPISGPYATDSGPVSETIVVPSGGYEGLYWSEDLVNGGHFTEFSNLTLTCTLGAAPLPVGVPVDEIALISTGAQQRSLNASLNRNFRSRFGGDSASFISGENVFVSTSGLIAAQPGGAVAVTPEVNAWVAATGRYYWDGYEGYSGDLLFGIDRLVGPDTILGLMIGAGVTDLEQAGVESSTDSLLIGAYAAHSVETFSIDGYLAYAAVDYDAGGTEFDTDRWLAGITLGTEHVLGNGTMAPRLSLSGSSEDFPTGVGVVGGEARNLTASVGARYDWAAPIASTGLMPFASLDLEYVRYEDTAGVTSDFVAPRIGFGVEGAVAGGFLSAGIDAGQTATNVYDAGLTMSFEIRF